MTGSSVPGRTGTPAEARQPSRSRLIPQQRKQFWSWSDEGNSRFFAGARKCGIFGQESVTGVDSVNALLLGERNNSCNIEIGFDRALACANLVGFVGLEAMKRQAVFLRVDSDGAQAQLVCGAENPNGDFTAIRR